MYARHDAKNGDSCEQESEIPASWFMLQDAEDRQKQTGKCHTDLYSVDNSYRLRCPSGLPAEVPFKGNVTGEWQSVPGDAPRCVLGQANRGCYIILPVRKSSGGVRGGEWRKMSSKGGRGTPCVTTNGEPAGRQGVLFSVQGTWDPSRRMMGCD